MFHGSFSTPQGRRRLLLRCGIFVIAVVFTVGVFASNGWFPGTDRATGKRTGWFGAPLAKNAPSSWNPLAMPSPTATPHQLSKEYVYAGSRLLAVEDKNATAVPPADLVIWRPGTQAVWYVWITASQWTTHNWGQTGDVPVPGDFDGDGTTDFSIWRESNFTWYVQPSSTGGMQTYVFGDTDDEPAPADFDGDGKTDEAVYRPSNSTWYVHGSTAGFYYESSFTASGDLAAPADYDGDGKADLAVFRPSDRSFRVKLSSTGATDTSISLTANPSSPIWKPVSADYDGDGKADHAVYNAASGVWYIRSSATGTFPSTPTTWGQAGDIPVHNDYDADGKVDYAVWRPSNGIWYIVQSGSSYSQRQTQWGQNGDTPVPAFYRR